MTFKDIMKITFNLVVLYIVGGLLLATVYSKTSPIIFRLNEEEKQEALRQMMPEAELNEKLGDWEIHEKHAEYYAAKKGEETLGYIVQTFGKGYSSYINILFSVNSDFKIQKIDILHHAETPGLGDEIEFDSFKNLFIGKGVEQMKVDKMEPTDNILAITGATISTRAVAEDGIKNGLIFLKSALEGGQTHGASSH